VRLIEKGHSEGIFQSTIDAGDTAEILISLIEGGSVLAKVTGEILHAQCHRYDGNHDYENMHRP
jgi:hypothetical protein